MQKIRAGYKMTDIGIIPEGWATKQFGELYMVPSKNGLMRPKAVRGNGYKMVNMTEIFAYDFIDNPEMELVPLNEREKKDFSLKPGDLLFARQSLVASGAGKCSIIISCPEITTFESHLIRVRLEKNIVCPMYYYFFFVSKFGRQAIAQLVTQVAAAGIRGSELQKIVVPIPNIREQEKISEILFTVEKHIGQIDTLIEKTKELKKGLIQKLLTKGIGNTEFKDTEIGLIPKDWEVKSVGQLFDIYGGMPIPRSKLGDNGSLYLHYGDIHKRDTNYIDTERDSDWLPRIDESEIKKAGTKLSNGDIVFADASEDYEGIGKSVVIFNQAEEVFYSGLHTIVAKSKTDELDHIYKRYCFGTNKVRSQFRAIASGATVFGISKTAIKDIKILVPRHEEQRKIAETLSTIDEMISEYIDKLKKLTSIKKSLMNKLLTGKVRVRV